MAEAKKKVVLLNDLEHDVKNREFKFETASNIFAIQKQKKRKDWTLAEGQPYELKDGLLVERTNSSDSSKGKQA
jgi:hypothetical protein